jgi:hypothetical protein
MPLLVERSNTACSQHAESGNRSLLVCADRPLHDDLLFGARLMLPLGELQLRPQHREVGSNSKT